MSKAIVNLLALKATNLAVSTEETRFYLQGVFIDIQPRNVTYVATDGHIMFVYRDELKEPRPAKVYEKDKYPSGIAPGEPDNELTGSWIIPSNVIKGLKLPKRGPQMATLEGKTGERRLTLELPEGQSIGFEAIDGTFPDWKRVIPSEIDPAAPVQVYNPHFLVTMWKIGETLGIGNPMIHHNGVRPALLQYGNVENALGLIMPMRDRAGAWQAPAWAQTRPVTQSDPAEESKQAA